jgi:hypothetical protein
LNLEQKEDLNVVPRVERRGAKLAREKSKDEQLTIIFLHGFWNLQGVGWIGFLASPGERLPVGKRDGCCFGSKDLPSLKKHEPWYEKAVSDSNLFLLKLCCHKVIPIPLTRNPDYRCLKLAPKQSCHASSTKMYGAAQQVLTPKLKHTLTNLQSRPSWKPYGSVAE